MQYYATHYWQSDTENAASLILQQAYHRKRHMPVLLACVEGNIQKEWALAPKLSDWFYGTGLTMCSRLGERGAESIAGSLREILEKQLHSTLMAEGYCFAGIMCMGECCMLFQWGRQKIYLLNTRNHHSYIHGLEMVQGKSGGLQVQTGIIQSGAGILVGTERFMAGIPHTMLEECLYVRELRTQSCVDRRLKELGDFAERRGGIQVAAVLLVAR